MKKTLLLYALIIFETATFALNCPTPDMIAQGQMNGFIALNANNNLAASDEAVEKFIGNIGPFYLASFFEDGSINAHCYYQGFLEVYLGRMVSAILQTPKSRWLSQGQMHNCSSSRVEECGFVGFNYNFRALHRKEQ